MQSFVSLEDESLFCSGGEKLCLWTKDGDLLHMRSRAAEEGGTEAQSQHICHIQCGG